ncbi:MAG: DUF4215 domain-containing protein [Myxococcota bacterium]
MSSIKILLIMIVFLFAWGCSPDGETSESECGNGITEQNEECDDGNTEDGDGCSSTCMLETENLCGNGEFDPGEECDDGNTENGDGCSEDCKLETGPVCGNGTVEHGEECDDGNTENGDGCNENCQSEYCGNGIVEGEEECDDGNTEAGDGCDEQCRVEECGNNRIDAGEECDGSVPDGWDCTDLGGYGGSLSCDENCNLDDSTCGYCGDGQITVGFEECDDGNSEAGDGCENDCTATSNYCYIDQDLGTFSGGSSQNASVDLSQGRAAVVPSCSLSSGREKVYKISFSEYVQFDLNVLSANMPFNFALYRLDDTPDQKKCENFQELYCGEMSAGDNFQSNLGAGDYIMVVDANSATSLVTAELDITIGETDIVCDSTIKTDSYGYVGCVTTSNYSFYDIQSVGTKLGASDDSAFQSTLPFSFDFYGSGYTSVYASTNGTLSFGTSVSSLGNSQLPDGSYNNFVAAWWDDLDSGNDNADGIWTYVQGSAPNRKVYFQWQTERYSSTPEKVVFQIILHETTNQIDILFSDTVFGSTTYDHGLSSTTGIQGSTSSTDDYFIQYQYDANPQLTDGLSLTFYHP